MNRLEFIQKCALMGMGVSILPSALVSCSKDETLNINFEGKVLVIGAGAAGLMAAYTLNRYGIDFEVIEASSVYGGRVKKIEGFADFPIDLGAEWIHDQPSVFSEMFDGESVDGSVEMIAYTPETVHNWDGQDITERNWMGHFYGEFKFKNSTWHDFFADYIVPNFSEKITYNSPIETIDYSGGQVVVTNANGDTFEGDKIILTAPIAVLKAGLINFVPELPSSKTAALDKTYVPDGLKVFIEFSERFYPDLVNIEDTDGGSDGADEKVYYDAAFKKDASRHVLGLFTIGTETTKLTELGSDEAIFDAVMEELDQIFDGKATQFYLNHVVQNWSAEPFVRGSYTHFNGTESSIMDDLRAPLDSKVYFAGEALYAPASATVHGAGMSGRDVAKTIISGS